MPSFGPATRKLKGKLGRRVTTDHDALFAASFDGSKLSFLPEAVIRPKTKADIAATLALANRHQVPVTTRGSGSSLTGSGSPIQGGWVLDLSGWNKITVDAEAGFAHVQAEPSQCGRGEQHDERPPPPDPVDQRAHKRRRNASHEEDGRR